MHQEIPRTLFIILTFLYQSHAYANRIFITEEVLFRQISWHNEFRFNNFKFTELKLVMEKKKIVQKACCFKLLYVCITGIPQVTVPATVSVNIGSTATLTCSIQANPTHNSISWQRIDGNNQATTITIDNNKYSGATVNNPTLTITNVQMSDRVNYVCFATNSVGTGQSGSLFLNVQGSK